MFVLCFLMLVLCFLTAFCNAGIREGLWIFSAWGRIGWLVGYLILVISDEDKGQGGFKALFGFMFIFRMLFFSSRIFVISFSFSFFFFSSLFFSSLPRGI